MLREELLVKRFRIEWFLAFADNWTRDAGLCLEPSVMGFPTICVFAIPIIKDPHPDGYGWGITRSASL